LNRCSHFESQVYYNFGVRQIIPQHCHELICVLDFERVYANIELADLRYFVPHSRDQTGEGPGGLSITNTISFVITISFGINQYQRLTFLNFFCANMFIIFQEFRVIT
jgi:hypothetical protein